MSRRKQDGRGIWYFANKGNHPKAIEMLIEGEDGFPLLQCPSCDCQFDVAEADSLGADEDCLFCPKCNKELECP
jgi:hypothetical protein